MLHLNFLEYFFLIVLNKRVRSLQISEKALGVERSYSELNLLLGSIA